MEFKKFLKCRRCSLAATRRTNCVVTGRGSLKADILFIGEAPDNAEEILKKPIVGQARKVLEHMIDKATKQSRHSDISYFITNIVMCRPVHKKTKAYREPSKIEILKCTKNLMEIYNTIQPKVIIFMDKTALNYYKKEFNSTFSIINPKWHALNGGDRSPRFLTDVQTIREALKCVK